MDSSNHLQIAIDVDLIKNIPDGSLFMLTYFESFLSEQLAVINHQVELQDVGAWLQTR